MSGLLFALQLGGGYVFGLFVGFAADSIGSTAGATAAFLVRKNGKKLLTYHSHAGATSSVVC